MKASEIRCKYCGHVDPRSDDRCPSGQQCEADTYTLIDWEKAFSDAETPTVQKLNSRSVVGARRRQGIDVAHFQARVLQDAMTQGTALYWLGRAKAWEAARPKRGDYHGRATTEQLREADERCVEIAENCRRHADLIGAEASEEISSEIYGALGEVA